MSCQKGTNQQIAKNAVFLYVRMLLSVVVSLYTSRVVLRTLGVDDFGIYGVVGSVVAMFSFLNAAMSGATSRFLTFEMGKNDITRVRDTFSSAMIIHIGIAAIMFLMIEIIGVWFLYNRLVIPEGRITAAFIVLQCSVVGMFFTVTQVPYNAVIVAHEKMDVYAYVELFNVFLKLGIVYLLAIGSFDKLILYAILQLFVCIIVALVYRIYCLKYFRESHLHWVWDKSLLKPMLSYSGWDLFGNFSVTIKQQGIVFLVNIFFGVAFNAAAAVAATVEGTLLGFCNNVITAFRPQIIKQYSAGNEDASVNYIYQAAKISTILFIIVAVPFICEMDFIMKLWLGNPPEYASLFCRIMMISGSINLTTCAFNVGINATGRMKVMSFSTGICFIGIIPILYICYTLNAPVETAYYLAVILGLVTTAMRGVLLHKYIKTFSYNSFFFKVLVPILVIAVTLALFTLPFVQYMRDCVNRCVVIFIFDIALGTVLFYFGGLTKNQRLQVIDFLKLKLCK